MRFDRSSCWALEPVLSTFRLPEGRLRRITTGYWSVTIRHQTLRGSWRGRGLPYDTTFPRGWVRRPRPTRYADNVRAELPAVQVGYRFVYGQVLYPDPFADLLWCWRLQARRGRAGRSDGSVEWCLPSVS